MSSAISEHVRAFILENIQSVEQLELLLLLRREGARRFTGDEAARELRVHPASATRWLEDLTARKLASREGDRFQFNHELADRQRDVDGLASAYAEARAAVIQTIFTQPSDAVRSFADAFRLRGKP